MIRRSRRFKSDLAVVGSGIAGCAATVFAQARGLKTTQIGNTGALAYTSGYFDLLGVTEGSYIKSPWQGLAQLREKEPDHPYAKLSDEDIRDAFGEFIKTLGQMGLNYSCSSDSNQMAMLPAGACKPTFCVPGSMQKGAQAMSSRARVLIIDFVGLQGFSAKEIVVNLKTQWPQLRAEHVRFPEMETGAQIFPEVMARALEVTETREAFARRLKPIVKDAEYIAMPAILGIHRPDYIHSEMEKLVGLPIFEIPTIPPAVAGIRLRELFDQQLPAIGATIISQHRVERVELDQNAVRLFLKDSYGPVEIEAKYIIMASGRFLSGGLKADQHQIIEALMGLPVHQPEGRENWFSESYFDLGGHAVNQSGIIVNDNFQPLSVDGEIIDQRLYAAGILLAKQDWIRQRCGAGLAIATAYKAVNTIAKEKCALQ